ncbi:12919_t:CDS:2, partial [Dentiscutata erythropus]
GLIHNDPGFSNKSKTLQRPVWQQLAFTLKQLNCNGNGASVEKFARQWGLEIGTVIKYTKQVIVAINSIDDNYVQWFNFFERQQISNRIEQLSEFKGCIGFLNDTNVVLKYKPSVDDCGYQLTPTTIVLYKQPQARKVWVFEWYKNSNYIKKNLKFVLDIIKTTIILYNLALNNNDIWEETLIKTNLNLINPDSLMDKNLNKAGKKM